MSWKRNTGPRLEEAGNTANHLRVFRSREFVAAGHSREYLRRLVERKQVQRLGRGLYVAATFDGDHHRSLVEAVKRAPRGVVCLMSALQFHEIGTQSPFQVWLALPRGINWPRTGDLPFRFCKFSPASYAFGIQEHKLPGGIVRVYSPAKTVADCFKYRNKFGLDVAVEALREGWRSRRFTLDELVAAAEVCRIRRVIQPYLEMLA